MAVTGDRKYTSEYVFHLLEGVKGKTLGEVDSSNQFARINLPTLSNRFLNYRQPQDYPALLWLFPDFL